MAERARQIATGGRLWRGAALAVLGGGIGVALWRDPALLERREVTLPLALAFAALIIGFLVWLEKVSPWRGEIGPNADGVPTFDPVVTNAAAVAG